MKRDRVLAALFAIYCALMLWLLFVRPGYTPGIPYAQQLKMNFLPFATILRYVRLMGNDSPELVRHAAVNLFGNILMFIPLGFCLPMIWSKLRRLWKVLLVTTLIISLVELIQMVTLVGTCDVDDLILNVFGSAIGYGAYRISCKQR